MLQWKSARLIGLLVTLGSLEVGGARVAPLRVYSHDAQMGGDAHGLLGRDFLNHFRVTIDNVRGVVELTPQVGGFLP